MAGKIIQKSCTTKRITYFFNFLFCIGIQPINNVVIVPGGPQRDSATHIHVCILPQTPLPSRLPHNIEQEFHVLYNRSLLVIHFKYSSVYIWVFLPLFFFTIEQNKCSFSKVTCNVSQLKQAINKNSFDIMGTLRGSPKHQWTTLGELLLWVTTGWTKTHLLKKFLFVHLQRGIWEE